MATRMPLILCSTTFSISGLGPLDMTVRALAWVTDRTVAALNQGTPKIDEIPPMVTRMSRSQWKPDPFIIFRSGLLTISLRFHREKGAREERKISLHLWSLLDCSCTGTGTHVVIWDSRKIRMNTSRAGTQQAGIIQIGKSFFSPMGLMNQPLTFGLVTSIPFGTTSF